MTPGNKSGATFLISSSPAPPESETYTTVDKRLYQRNQTGILRPCSPVVSPPASGEAESSSGLGRHEEGRQAETRELKMQRLRMNGEVSRSRAQEKAGFSMFHAGCRRGQAVSPFACT